ncbi:RcpC/CpaB family pilus assembly protein [Streptomyces tremellae]|uniref:Flp pilus assembly protein RcpC/CpaB domain-containing protein n=1 Tax=Streptomyces tremellae TaxID=1124239 RepID=A0ABP7ENE6_9ACTN
MPEPRGVPAFDPVRVRGQRDRLRRAVLRRQRVMAAGLAVGAAVLAPTGAGGATGAAGPVSSRTGPDARAGEHTGAGGRQDTPVGAEPAARPPDGPAERGVSAPVRIADAATVRLLRPGDRVDVIATPAAVPGAADRAPEARTVASGVRVAEIPDAGPDDPVEGGALLVLSVSRRVAAELAAAAPVSQLAVTLC